MFFSLVPEFPNFFSTYYTFYGIHDCRESKLKNVNTSIENYIIGEDTTNHTKIYLQSLKITKEYEKKKKINSYISYLKSILNTLVFNI